MQQDDASVAYVKDAQWVEAPQRLFQRLLSETVAAKTPLVVLDEGPLVLVETRKDLRDMKLPFERQTH